MAHATRPPLRVLSDDGLDEIANHKYVGGAYTPLDTLLNPFWFWCTERLPMWMAPNLVTLVALAHGAAAYALLAWYTPHMCGAPPAWVYAACAYCVWAYQTLDAMDGKQARRTQQSSPLGQLFDHGCDAAVNIAFHAIAVALLGFSCGGAGREWEGRLSMLGNVSLLMAFFFAQWQEYHTRVLNTSYGPVGVTETHYTIIVGCLSAATWGPLPSAPVAAAAGVPVIGTLPANHLAVYGWVCFSAVLITLCVAQTLTDRRTPARDALLQLLSPAAVAAGSMLWESTVYERQIRLTTLTTSLLLVWIINEMIVSSMARQAVRACHPGAVLYVAACAATRFFPAIPAATIGPIAGDTALILAVLAYVAFGLQEWTAAVIRQICDRLGIKCFRIPYNAKKKKAE